MYIELHLQTNKVVIILLTTRVVPWCELQALIKEEVDISISNILALYFSFSDRQWQNLWTHSYRVTCPNWTSTSMKGLISEHDKHSGNPIVVFLNWAEKRQQSKERCWKCGFHERHLQSFRTWPQRGSSEGHGSNNQYSAKVCNCVDGHINGTVELCNFYCWTQQPGRSFDDYSKKHYGNSQICGRKLKTRS